MTDTITKAMQDAYWDEWQQTQDHWLALAAALKAKDAEAVAVVQLEQDYWSRGHFYKGSRKIPVELKGFGDLPVGTKLYAAPKSAAREPTPAMIKAGEDAYWRKHCDMTSPTPTEEPGIGPMGYAYLAMLAAAGEEVGR